MQLSILFIGIEKNHPFPHLSPSQTHLNSAPKPQEEPPSKIAIYREERIEVDGIHLLLKVWYESIDQGTHLARNSTQN
jgi:hypothetical protein